MDKQKTYSFGSKRKPFSAFFHNMLASQEAIDATQMINNENMIRAICKADV